MSRSLVQHLRFFVACFALLLACAAACSPPDLPPWDAGDLPNIESDDDSSAPEASSDATLPPADAGDADASDAEASASAFAITGSISGLVGSGLALENNHADRIAVHGRSFVFPTRLGMGVSYDVTVHAQPTDPPQTCIVSHAIGFVPASDVTNVSVACTTRSFLVGGAAVGLTHRGLVLRNEGGDDRAVDPPDASTTTFTFATPVASAGAFAVTIAAQPSGQTCRIAGGAGTVVAGDVSTVLVMCDPAKITLSGSVSGLEGRLVMGVSGTGAADLAVNANGGFAFPIGLDPGTKFDVFVKTQPSSPSQGCTVSSGAGVAGNVDVASAVVRCQSDRFAIGGAVSGLAGAGLVLQNEGGDDVPLVMDGPFTFPTPLRSGQAFAATVKTQPTNRAQTCQITGGAGVVGSAHVTGIAVSCAP